MQVEVVLLFEQLLTFCHVPIVPFSCLIVDLVLTERHIAHRQIVEITAVGGLKTGYGNVCLRVQLLGDAPGDAVQFHTI